MRRLAIALVLLVQGIPVVAQAPLAAAPLVTIQHEIPVYMASAVRAQLNASWDDHNPQQPERGYCLVVERGVVRGDTINVVSEAYRAVPDGDDPYWVSFDCGPRQVFLHVHTPTTCDVDPRTGSTLYQTCKLDGPDAYLCRPSGQDQRLANHMHAPFLLIQCAQNAFIAFFPEVVAPTDGTTVQHASP